MRKADEVSASKVFIGFKEYADSKDVIEVVRDVKSVLGKYRDFQTSDSLIARNKRFRDRMQVMQMGVVTPVLLRLLASHDQSDQRFVQALYALESFMVRRMVCRRTTKDYNSMMQSLLRALDADETSAVDNVVVNFLKEQKADARIWPDDYEVRKCFRTEPVYRQLTRGRLRLVLEGIEEQMRDGSDMEGTLVRPNLTIEHVMPQAWPTNWPLPAPSEDMEDPGRHRNHVIHTIGNLTLTNFRLNARLSNAPWESKKQTLNEHSGLFLNNDLAGYEAWDEQAIAARSERLANVFAKAWPGPDSPYWDSPTAS